MMRRNDFSVVNQAVATQRNTIAPHRQRLTRPVRWRTPECGDSMTLVMHRQRRSVAGKPKRFAVNVSAKPSRKLAAADGCSLEGKPFVGQCRGQRERGQQPGDSLAGTAVAVDAASA